MASQTALLRVEGNCISTGLDSILKQDGGRHDSFGCKCVKNYKSPEEFLTIFVNNLKILSDQTKTMFMQCLLYWCSSKSKTLELKQRSCLCQDDFESMNCTWLLHAIYSCYTLKQYRMCEFFEIAYSQPIFANIQTSLLQLCHTWFLGILVAIGFFFN